MIRALLLLALAACGGKKDPPPAARATGSGSALGIVEPFKAGDDLPFSIDEITLHQKRTDAPPWHADGGTFTYFTAHLTADPKATFAFGIPEQSDSMSRKGWLAPTTADAGARIVAAYAQVFSVPPPAPVAGAKLAPVEILMAAIGDNSGKDPDGGFSGEGTWSTYKWFCSADDVDGAEVFFNVSLAEKAGEWSEKDADDDPDVAHFLAMVLRDGVPPPRTAANDPTLAAAGPTVTLGKKLGADTIPPVAVTPRRVLFASDDGRHGIVTAYDLVSGAPTELYRTGDRVEGGGCNEDASVCALTTSSPGKDRARSTFDEGKHVVILAGGKATPVKLDGKVSFVLSVSPDARWALIGLDDGIAAIEIGGKRVSRLVQPGDTYTDNFLGWTGKGAVARIQRRAGMRDEPTTGTWDPAADTGQLVPGPNVQARPLASPDGKREVTIAATGVVTVVAGGAPRTFTLHPHDRGAATPDCCRWIDDRWLGMQTKRAYVFIDTDALKVSLAPETTGEIRPVPGAGVALAGRDDGWYLATITPPP